MKTIKLTLIVTLLNLVSVYAQNNESDYNEIFKKCEITYSDGKIINGYIAFFMEAKKFDSADLIDSSIEHILNLDDNHFEFKESLSANPKNMSQKDLSTIKIFSKNGLFKIYKLMNVKSLTKEGLVINSSKKAWLPIVKEGYVNLYQINMYNNINNSSFDEYDDDVKKKTKYKYLRKTVTITYLGNQDVAFEIYNFNQFKLFTSSFGSAYLAKVLQYLFNDCPSFLDKIIKKGKWDYELYNNTTVDYNSQIKSIKKSDATDEEKHYLLDDIYIKQAAEPFIKLIEDYKTNCKK